MASDSFSFPRVFGNKSLLLLSVVVGDFSLKTCGSKIVFYIFAQSPINLLTLESVVDFLHGGLVHYPFLSLIQKSLKKEHFLWQLSNIEKDIEKTTEELEDEMKSREDVLKDLDKYEREAGRKKKEQSKYSKEITQLEKKIAERSNKLDKNVSLSNVLAFFFLWGGVIPRPNLWR